MSLTLFPPFFAKCILLVAAAAAAAEAAEAEAEVDSHGNVLNDRPANRKCLTDRQNLFIPFSRARPFFFGAKLLRQKICFEAPAF